MVTEDFTTYAELDPLNKLTKTADRSTLAQIYCSQAQTYLRGDKGAGGIPTALIANFSFMVTYFDSCPPWWALCDFPGRLLTFGNSSTYPGNAPGEGFISIQLYALDWSINEFRLLISPSDYSVILHDSILYYCTLIRNRADGERITLQIFNDAARTVLIDEIHSDTSLDTSYRYVFLTSNIYDDTWSPYPPWWSPNWSGYLESLNLNGSGVCADAGDNQTVFQDEITYFNGNQSVGAEIYDWDFGDGTPHGSGMAPTHVYTTDGDKIVTLIVTGGGQTSTDTITITVCIPITAEAGPNQSVEIGDTVVLDGSGSTGPITSYVWTFNHGVGVTRSGITANHVFPGSGTYTVTLTVYEANGLSKTDTMIVTVADAIGGSNVVVNGSFEAGLSGWVNLGASIIDATAAYSGAYSVNLHDTPDLGIQQTINRVKGTFILSYIFLWGLADICGGLSQAKITLTFTAFGDIVLIHNFSATGWDYINLLPLMADVPDTDILESITIENETSYDLLADVLVIRAPFPYPNCTETETTIYGCVLIIDPLGIRADNPGPLCFLVNKAEFSPGITERSGIMTAYINDNANDKHPDLHLLREGTEYIRDDDEFWIGVQRGVAGVWNPIGGPDGEGSGTKWLMGGYIVNRQYEYGPDTKILAVITGAGFMDVWKDVPFGRPTRPRNYATATDLATIAYDVLDDVNFLQPVGWRYTRDPSYFPASAILTVNALFFETLATVDDANGFVVGDALIFDDDFPEGEVVTISSVDIDLKQVNFLTTPIQRIEGYHVSKNAKMRQTILGSSWLKEFKQEPSGEVMADICDRSNYIWRINYLRQVKLYDRPSAPEAPNIRYDTNVRDVPALIMGGTDEKITHVIVSDGESNTVPPSIDAWSSCQLWFDPDHTPRERDASFAFGPPNPQPPGTNSKLTADAAFGDIVVMVNSAYGFLLGPALISDDDFPAGETVIVSDTFDGGMEDEFLLTNPTDFSDTWVGLGWSGWYEHCSFYLPSIIATHRILERAYMKAKMDTDQILPECLMEVRCLCRVGDLGAWVQFGDIAYINNTETRECLFEGTVTTGNDESLSVAFQYRMWRGVFSTFVTGHEWDSEISGAEISSDWVEFFTTPITQAAGYQVSKNARIEQSFATADPTYADRSLIFDTEGHPGMCFQNDLSPQFNLNLSNYTNAAGDQVYNQLCLDLREIRRVHFMFRHATRTGPDSTYKIFLKGKLNDYWFYDFGIGTQETSGDSDHDTIDSPNWTEIDLALPEVDEAGSVINSKGWTPVHDPAIPDPLDPNYWKETDINWPAILVECNEPNPGTGPSQELIQDASAGDLYIKVLFPEEFAGFKQGTIVDKFMFNPPICLLEKNGTSEEVRIRKIGGTMPGSCNIELEAPLINNYPVGAVPPTLTPKAGWTISLSQLRFEKSIQYEDEVIDPVPPYRYRVMVSKEIEKLNEASSRADGIIAQEGSSKKAITVVIDGDPLFEVGMKTRVYFGVAPYENVAMIIDDATYTIEGGDFSIKMLLGTIDKRGRVSDELNVIQSQQRHIENLGWGKTVMKPR